MIKVIGDRVLVALPPREDEIVSPGGIVLVKDPERFHTPTRGIVVALGEKTGTVEVEDVLSAMAGYWLELSGRIPTHDGDQWVELPARDVRKELSSAVKALQPAPFDVQVGDCVIFPRSAGEEIRDGEIDYVIVREAEILGIVEPKETEAA